MVTYPFTQETSDAAPIWAIPYGQLCEPIIARSLYVVTLPIQHVFFTSQLKFPNPGGGKLEGVSTVLNRLKAFCSSVICLPKNELRLSGGYSVTSREDSSAAHVLWMVAVWAWARYSLSSRTS